jgi:hypothetical protein
MLLRYEIDYICCTIACNSLSYMLNPLTEISSSCWTSTNLESISEEARLVASVHLRASHVGGVEQWVAIVAVSLLVDCFEDEPLYNDKDESHHEMSTGNSGSVKVQKR